MDNDPEQESSEPESDMSREAWQRRYEVREQERIAGLGGLKSEGIIDDEELGRAIERKETPEGLLGQLEKDAFLYLVSRPGTCSRIFNVRGGIPEFDVFLEMAASGKQHGQVADERSLRRLDRVYLHVADNNGISSMLVSSEISPGDILRYQDDLCGVILKPTFLGKIAGSVTDDEIKQAEKANKIILQNIVNARDLYRDIRSGTHDVKVGETPYNDKSARTGMIAPDFGITAETLSKGQIVPVSITAEDVEYLYYFHRKGYGQPVRVRFYRLNGQRVAEKDIVELAKKSREEKVTERYKSAGISGPRI